MNIIREINEAIAEFHLRTGGKPASRVYLGRNQIQALKDWSETKTDREYSEFSWAHPSARLPVFEVNADDHCFAA